MPSMCVILAWWWQVIVGEIMLEKKDHGSKQEFLQAFCGTESDGKKGFWTSVMWCLA